MTDNRHGPIELEVQADLPALLQSRLDELLPIVKQWFWAVAGERGWRVPTVQVLLTDDLAQTPAGGGDCRPALLVERAWRDVGTIGPRDRAGVLLDGRLHTD